MYKKLLVLVLLAGLVLIFWRFFDSFQNPDQLNELAKHYVAEGPGEVGSANLVTAVVVTYRGFDTLGEVTILFVAAAIIGLFLKTDKHISGTRQVRPSSEILQTAQKILLPLIFLFGAYVFLNGHLSPGGGFQGGAIIASGVVLIILAKPQGKFSHALLSIIESVSGFAYVAIGVIGLLLAGGFLDNRFLPLGEFGSLFSAGAIPVIYILIGLKVGTELTNVLVNMKEIQNEE
ncbi:MAG: Na(+)/H(+) antiporter subunit B [Bacteroidota bacterium]